MPAGGTGTSGSAGTGGGMVPPGYWTYTSASPAYTWNGCVWTGVDTVTVAPHKSTITPTDFTTQAGTSGPYHVSGSVGQDPKYNGVALLGFNLAQPSAGANCAYDPASATAMGPPGVTFPTGPTGIAVNFSKTSSTGTVRIQIQGPNGGTDATQRWCYSLTQVQGKDFAPFSRFFTQCWNDDGTGKATAGNDIGAKYNGEPISAIAFNVPGTNNADLPYDFTVNGFALGMSAADAPDGGMQGSLSGTIGDTNASNSSTDPDFQRVKITGGTPAHSYIIQNNNWGNPSGTAQLITYKDNSFTVTSVAGGDPGGGNVRAFPSIYQGANGNVMAGTYSTINDDNMPKQISAIQSAQTTFTWSGGASGGNYNATYDVWFNSAAPNLTSYPASGYPEYKDGVSGFLMVWLYKPGQNNPIGGNPAHSNVTVPNVSGTWNVYIGPRGGSSSAPVISYVATSPLNTMTFDLKNFINDAVTNNYGLQNSWYLTDVFAGFEIWSGTDATGLKVSNFTLDVK